MTEAITGGATGDCDGNEKVATTPVNKYYKGADPSADPEITTSALQSLPDFFKY